ncbi:MAG: DUF721 domain-containing protein [candidate division NC10 bacterium]|nr:DUF721 domain-containing protein [candidate division NC10 bacterium]
MSHSGFTPFGKAVEVTLERLGLGAGLVHIIVHRVWAEVVGEEVARRSEPGLLRNGRLQVTVVDAVWLQQLTMLKPTILARLESHVGSQKVLDIFFTLGTLSFPAARPERTSRRRSDRPPPEMQMHHQEILRPVQDLECREVLARILKKAQEVD